MSVLGPGLFNMYANYLTDRLTSYHATFADCNHDAEREGMAAL